MFRVIICDDNNSFAEYEKELLLTSFDKGCLEATICNSGEDLLNSDLKKIDLIILDYEMDGLNGFETSERITDRLPHIPIVFSTVYIDLSCEGYKYHGFRFLVKQSKSFVADLIESVQSAMKQKKKYESKMRMIHFTTGNYNVNTDDIIYLETHDHYVDICFIDREKIEIRKIRSKADEIIKEIDNDSIVLIRKGVGVNFNYITKLNDVGRIRLSALNKTIKEFVVADNYLKEFRKAFLNHFGDISQ